MTEAFNPYAPPQSEIDTGPAAGAGVYRDGELVRMDLAGQLPDRCIRCNRSAEGYRAERALYWRPVWWRWTIWVSFPILFLLGTAEPLILMAFWLVFIGLAVGDFFVRRKFVVEYGLCKGHRNLRTGVFTGFALSWVVLIGLVSVGSTGFRAVEHGWFWAVALAMFVLGVAASWLYRTRIARLTEYHVWLKGTGRPFQQALPAAE